MFQAVRLVSGVCDIVPDQSQSGEEKAREFSRVEAVKLRSLRASAYRTPRTRATGCCRCRQSLWVGADGADTADQEREQTTGGQCITTAHRERLWRCRRVRFGRVVGSFKLGDALALLVDGLLLGLEERSESVESVQQFVGSGLRVGRVCAFGRADTACVALLRGCWIFMAHPHAAGPAVRPPAGQ